MKLSDLKISHRLAMLSSAFLIPIAVLAYFGLNGIEEPINFAKQERLGNRYQRPLERLLDGVPNYALLIKEGAEAPKIAEASSGIEEALKDLDTVNKEIGEGLGFTDEVLKKSGREQAKFETVNSNWEEISKQYKRWKPEQIENKINSLIAAVQTMITHAGDKSNLILDPDLDSYYLMDVTLLALPQTQSRIASILSYLAGLPKGTEVPAEYREQIAVHAAMLREADIARVKASSDTALKEDDNFYGRNPSMQKSLPPLVEKYSQATEKFANYLSQLSNGTNIAYSDLIASGQEAKTASFELWNAAVGELDTLLQNRISSFSSVKWWTIGLSLGSLILALCLAAYITRSIVSPFEHTMNRLSETSSLLLSSANQVSSSSQALAQGATEQAASLQESAAALEEISSSSKHNADNSQQAQNLSGRVLNLSQDGVNAMNSMVTAIHSIKKSADETAEIVKIIDEIAFQTNLLALNAAVEAARAGDAGKGFAVVAEEVRNLAQRSANAAKESSEKIRHSKDLADKGVTATEEVTKFLDTINQSSVKSADLVKEIAAASREQTAALSQVNIAITELDKVTQQNSAAAEETSASATEMTHQACSLDEVVHVLAGLVHGRAASKNLGNPKNNVKSKATETRSAPKAAYLTGVNQNGPTYAFRNEGSGQIIPLDEEELRGL